MRRIDLQPRQDWEARVESQGFRVPHARRGAVLGRDPPATRSTTDEIDEIERATYALDEMCLEAVQHVIDEAPFERFGIPERVRRLGRASWETRRADRLRPLRSRLRRRQPAEAARVQRRHADRRCSRRPSSSGSGCKTSTRTRDQFNSIHDKLIDAWQAIRAAAQRARPIVLHARSRATSKTS